MDFIPHKRSLHGTEPIQTTQALDRQPTEELIANTITVVQNQIQ
jgi:hypothetical protein